MASLPRWYTPLGISWSLPKTSDGSLLGAEQILVAQLKELRHDILSPFFFNGLSHGLSVGKPKPYGLLMKEETKGVILK